MSYWQLRSVGWTLGLGLVMIVALGLGAPPQVAALSPCEGFSGVCHGQCQAALAQGCFENPDTRQCGRHEEQWNQLNCPGTPPWVPPDQDCPCEGLTTGNATWSDAFATTRCQVFSDGSVKLTGRQNQSLSTNTGTNVGNECDITASGGLTFVSPLSAAQFDACNASLRQIAASDIISCVQ
jgi:hypothetical protein